MSAPPTPSGESARNTAAPLGSTRHEADLAGIAELPLDEHAEHYQRVHAELQDALAAIDDA